MNVIKFAKVEMEAVTPTRHFPEDAGLDLYLYSKDWPVDYTLVIRPQMLTVLRTGIAVDIPKGYVGLLKPRGRSSLLIGAGVIDAGYHGEILVKAFNATSNDIRLEHGDPVAQLLIVPVETPAPSETTLEELMAVFSDRGTTGGIWKQASFKASDIEVE